MRQRTKQRTAVLRRSGINHTTFAYVMNKMGQVAAAGSERTRKYTRLIYQAFG